RIAQKWREHRATTESLTSAGTSGDQESGLAAALSTYCDVYVQCRTWGNEAAFMEATVAHVLSHLEKARVVMAANDRVRRSLDEREQRLEEADTSAHRPKGKKSNASKSAKPERQVEDESTHEAAAQQPDDVDSVNLRDRGFGKTRVLIIVPMRNI